MTISTRQSAPLAADSFGCVASSPTTTNIEDVEPITQPRLPFLDIYTGLEDENEFDNVPAFVQLIPYTPLSLVEQQIVAVLNAVRNKRNWAVKFRESPTIRAKWRRELESQLKGRNKLRVLRYAFKELAWQAEHEPLAAGPDNVFASDSLLPAATRMRLVELAAKLEDVPEHKKDWHPKSNDQVLDLVHPSLFPVVYGKTCAFTPDQRANSVQESMARAGGQGGGVVQPPTEVPQPYDERFLSKQFQWLPAEIQVDAQGKSAQFVSYINNLHPDDHPELYQVLGDVFASMIPLFEQALVRIDCPRPIRICLSPDVWYNAIPIESGESEPEPVWPEINSNGGWPDEQQEEMAVQQNDVDNVKAWGRKFEYKHDILPLFAIDGGSDVGALGDDDNMDLDTASESEGIMTAAEMLEEIGSISESEAEDPSYVVQEIQVDEEEAYLVEDPEYPYEYYTTNDLTKFVTAPIGVTGQPEGITSFADDGFELYRPIVPRRFVPPAPVDVPTMSPHSQLAGKRLQVIVKLANIHLTPDNPTYPGGSWHVEGMLNESIIATGLYYYAMENITESRLHFRTFVQPPTVNHGQRDVLEDIYGLSASDMGWALCQGKGYSTAHEGRAVVFPNLYQHKVFPFELEDKSRPGYRKILAFFLIDPARSESGDVLSSAMVPPQQADWLAREFVKDERNPVGARLPAELVEMIGDQVAMTMEQAKEIRLELMEERSMSVSTSNELTYGAEYNLCEH